MKSLPAYYCEIGAARHVWPKESEIARCHEVATVYSPDATIYVCPKHEASLRSQGFKKFQPRVAKEQAGEVQ